MKVNQMLYQQIACYQGMENSSHTAGFSNALSSASWIGRGLQGLHAYPAQFGRAQAGGGEEVLGESSDALFPSLSFFFVFFCFLFCFLFWREREGEREVDRDTDLGAQSNSPLPLNRQSPRSAHPAPGGRTFYKTSRPPSRRTSPTCSSRRMGCN